jgi:hypothetical protein
MRCPAAGLDSTNAATVVGILAQLAGGGVTVVLSVHQPRPDVLATMRRALILSSTGQVVYSGAPTAVAAPRLHFRCAAHRVNRLEISCTLWSQMISNGPVYGSLRCGPARHYVTCLTSPFGALQGRWRRRGITLLAWATMSRRMSTSRTPCWTSSSAALPRRRGSPSLCRCSSRSSCQDNTHICRHHLDVWM